MRNQNGKKLIQIVFPVLIWEEYLSIICEHTRTPAIPLIFQTHCTAKHRIGFHILPSPTACSSFGIRHNGRCGCNDGNLTQHFGESFIFKFKPPWFQKTVLSTFRNWYICTQNAQYTAPPVECPQGGMASRRIHWPGMLFKLCSMPRLFIYYWTKTTCIPVAVHVNNYCVKYSITCPKSIGINN